MQERVIENWLTNANELAFTIPFCQVLISKGYEILKYSPKKATNEQGKDIIARDKSGRIKCYQLKGGNISLSDWRSEVKGQVEDLLDIEPTHPSLKNITDWDGYLVHNGDLIGEATQTIADWNRTRASAGKSTLEVISLQSLTKEFIDSSEKYIPTELKQFELFLELYNSDGADMLSIEKFAKFWETSYAKYLADDKLSRINQNEFIQMFNASMVINSYILGNYYRSDNYVSIIHGWLVLLQASFAVVERYNISSSKVSKTIEMVKAEVYSLNKDLFDEFVSNGLLDRKNGRAFTEALIFRERFTFTISLMSTIFTAEIMDGGQVTIGNEFTDYVLKNNEYIKIVSEAGVPGLLLFTILLLVLEKQEGAQLFVVILNTVVETGFGNGIPDVYHDFLEVEKHQLGVRLGDTIDETWERTSWSLQSLVLFTASLDQREMLIPIWKKITHIRFLNFYPEEPWMYFLRRSAKGEQVSAEPTKTQSWKSLTDFASTTPDNVPELFDASPANVVLLWAIYPHRFNEATTRSFINSTWNRSQTDL